MACCGSSSQWIFLWLTIATLTDGSSMVVTFPGLQEFLKIFVEASGGNAGQKPAALGTSVGQCHYDFVDYISHRDRELSYPDDIHIQHLSPKFYTAAQRRKTANCLQPDPLLSTPGELLEPQTIKEIVELLKPAGNGTKRDEPGRCVVVYFYMKSCYTSALIAPHINYLPVHFPTLQFVAIDAGQISSFNTEFGVVGVPALMLFHQGKPIEKLSKNAESGPDFVTMFTGIRPKSPFDLNRIQLYPLLQIPIKRFDWQLLLAWSFIILCTCYYFAISETCKNILEIIKQTWRESSEAQMAR